MQLIVPNQIRYGVQKRYDTYGNVLGYMIYANKSDGKYGQQASFDGWRDKSIPAKDIGNEYQLGFVLNKGHLNKYHFGASARFRVFHPEGFEFEISLENLSLLLDMSVISYGEIQVPCCIAWEGSNVFLLPKVDLKGKIDVVQFNVLSSQEQAKKRRDKMNNNGKAVSPRSIIDGRIFEDTNGDRFYVSAPTKTNYNKSAKSLFVTKNKEKGFFEIKSLSGNDYHPTPNNTGVEKMFFPLTNVGGIIKKDISSSLMKIVENEDLTKFEKSQLKVIEEYPVTQFSLEQKFKPLEKTEEALNALIEKVKHLHVVEKINKYGNEGNVIILDEVIKFNNKLYYIVVGTTYRYGYGESLVPEKDLKKIHEIIKEEVYGYSVKHEENLIFLVPLTTDNDKSYAANDVRNRSEKLFYLMKFKNEPKFSPVVQENIEKFNQIMKENFFKMMEPLTQEEIDNQKRIYMEQ